VLCLPSLRIGEPTILGRTWLSFPAGYGLSSGHASTERVGIEVKALHVRRMTHKCGSCSTAGRLTFNAELLFEAAEVRKKVIVHELLHLKVPNRGRCSGHCSGPTSAVVGRQRYRPLHGSGHGKFLR
jgi:hypothetical protein